MLDSVLMKQIFVYLKPFDASKTDADEENYYLEREWRIVGDVQFSLQDITRILIPEKYGKNERIIT
ncbi:abortive infection system antitoxin AbiGi family protein [Virgibacillus tibetensis]